jgi:hypothetical protein
MSSTSTSTGFSARCIALRWRAVLVLFLGLILGTTMAWADGKAFPPVAVSTEVTMPDQRALLVWSNGVERLAIETRIVGEGTNFAWVVPLPSVPKVEAATTGLFPTLAWLTPPKVVNAPGPIGWCLWSASGLACLFLRVRRKTPVEWLDAVAILAIAAGLVGLGDGWLGVWMAMQAIALSGLAVWRLRRGEPVWFSFVLLLVAVLLWTAVLLPALATAGGSAPSQAAADGVQVLDRQVAGVFESTTVSAKDPAALETWLKTNGYRLPESSRPVIAAYVRDGWVFVASRVQREAQVDGPHALHPLVFTFATPSPVYPLRLTGVDNGPLKVELFVLGPARARIPGFEVVDARPTAYPDLDSHIGQSRSTSRSAVNVVHSGLRSLAGDAAFATRLNATLSPEQMREDAIVEWDGSIPYQQVRYSAQGAGVSCMQWFGGGWLVSLVLMSAGVRLGRWSGRPWVGMVSGSLVLAAVVGAVCFLWMPVVPVRLESVFQWSITARRAEGVFFEAGLEFKAGDPLPAVESVRTAIRKVLNEDRPPWMREIRGMREEDSPRNYVVRAVPGDVEMVYFGDAGEERVFRLRDLVAE